MPLQREYGPSKSAWARNQAERYEASGWADAGKLKGRPHEAHGSEKAEWWPRAVAVWPDYYGYQMKTSRQIPLFVLEPM